MPEPSQQSKQRRNGSVSRLVAFAVHILIVLLLLGEIASHTTPHAYAVTIDPTATTVYGQGGSFASNTANSGGVSATSLSGPRRVAADGSGGLYIADTGNNRVLHYASGSTTANRVYGQLSQYTTNSINIGGITAGTLSGPRGLAVDSSGGLYIADTGNNRVLYFPSGLTTATRVYGQTLFTGNTANSGGVSATSLNQPSGVALDSNNNLYIADTTNNRVLYYTSGSTTATRVYGQGGSFTSTTSNNGGISSTSLSAPQAVALDSSNNLYISDTPNHRVLYYASGSTTATRVYGQLSSFFTGTVNKGGISANSLNQPEALRLDANNNLYIVDFSNNRVLYYTSGSTTATRVYGQSGSFTANNINTTAANTLNQPRGVATDSSGAVYIADTSNNRVLKFQTTISITTQPPSTVGINATFTVVVTIVDAGTGGNFSDYTDPVSITIKSGTGTTGATLGGTTTVSAVNGVATFSNLSINTSGTGYILTATSANVGSVNTNSFNVSGALTFTPGSSPSFSFTLTGAATNITTQYTFKVNDTTASGVGWHTTITSTQFTTTAGKTLPTSSTKITAVTAACTPSTTCVLPTNTTSYPVTVPAGTTAPTAVTFFNATAGTGTGDTTMTITFSITIPQGSAAGTYTSTFTIALVKGQ